VVHIISGFATNKGKPGSILGPSGVLYNQKADTMYVVVGASFIVYSFIHVYDDLDQANAIVIGSGGKTFTGPKAKDAKVLYSGTSLKSPITATLLPNGNLVVGNTGSNTLVEIATNGNVLATKTVDKGAKGAIFGLAAIGSNDTNTQIYFNDDNANNVQLLTK
jgi:DNA-binding beta-propeller fold protein YncE